MSNKKELNLNMFKKCRLLLIIFVFVLMLSSCCMVSVETYESDPEQYELIFKGDIYYGSEYCSWRISDDKFIGFEDGLGSWVYKSIGKDRNKFLEIWSAFNKGSMGYGIFIREDIEINPPSSQNVSKICVSGGEELDFEIKTGILEALDAYNNSDIQSVSASEARNTFDIDYISQIFIYHNEYNLVSEMGFRAFNDNYYLISKYGNDNEFIPLTDETGKKLEEFYY